MSNLVLVLDTELVYPRKMFAYSTSTATYYPLQLSVPNNLTTR